MSLAPQERGQRGGESSRASPELQPRVPFPSKSRPRPGLSGRRCGGCSPRRPEAGDGEGPPSFPRPLRGVRGSAETPGGETGGEQKGAGSAGQRSPQRLEGERLIRSEPTGLGVEGGDKRGIETVPAGPIPTGCVPRPLSSDRSVPGLTQDCLGTLPSLGWWSAGSCRPQNRSCSKTPKPE